MTTRKATMVALATLVAGMLLGPAMASAQTEQTVPHTIVEDVNTPPQPDGTRTWRNPVALASTQTELDQLWIDFAFAYTGAIVSPDDSSDAWRDVPPPPIDLDAHVVLGCVCWHRPEGVYTDGRGRLFVHLEPPGIHTGAADIRERRVLLTMPRSAHPGQSFQLIYREGDKTWLPVSVTLTGQAGPELAATGPPPLAPVALALLLAGAALITASRQTNGRSG